MLITLGIVFVITLLIGIPVAFSLGLAAMAALIDGGLPLTLIVQRFYNGINSFPLLAIPMFVFAGELMRRSGLIEDLLKFADALVGHITGGLGHVNILASMFFGGMTGAAVADTTALGPLEIKMMTDAGYDRDFSTAVTISSSCIGPIIPPSIPMVLYGVTTGVSIGDLFLGGVMPGILVGLALMTVVYIISKKRNYPRREGFMSLRDTLRSLKAGLVAMGIPVIVMGGITFGFVTPTEASALAVLYALIIGLVVFRNLSWSDLYESMLDTGITTGVVLMILGGAGAISYVITTEQVATTVGNFFLSHNFHAYLYLFLVNILLLLAGTVLDTGVGIIIFAPILAPIAASLGIDPVHFGIVVTINLVFGLLTPPVGSVLYMGCMIGKIKLEPLVKALVPFLLVEFGVVLLVTYVPPLVTFVPNLFK